MLQQLRLQICKHRDLPDEAGTPPQASFHVYGTSRTNESPAGAGCAPALATFLAGETPLLMLWNQLGRHLWPTAVYLRRRMSQRILFGDRCDPDRRHAMRVLDPIRPARLPMGRWPCDRTQSTPPHLPPAAAHARISEVDRDSGNTHSLCVAPHGRFPASSARCADIVSRFVATLQPVGAGNATRGGILVARLRWVGESSNARGETTRVQLGDSGKAISRSAL